MREYEVVSVEPAGTRRLAVRVADGLTGKWSSAAAGCWISHCSVAQSYLAGLASDEIRLARYEERRAASGCSVQPTPPAAAGV